MKMKKMFTGLVLFGATLALVACGKAEDKKATEETPATTVEATASAWKDGTYTGQSDFDERGWKVVHTITIKDGKIAESDFGYEDKDGKKKSDNEEYNKSMKEKSGISSKEATEKLNAELLATQNVDEVEVVTGATHSSENFTAATKALLAAAEEGKTDPVTIELGK
ncbi:major membrane immunogen, membrane-anchored lipoprotein [Streptococcus varani]|jgi:major membrane immunogen (membrane-anchored lipoprotein)|uniref:Major membrane immunogen, membrane-anchored lipoprotein n=1 Tax=Streptococcus varani TaxID=1608583 RepID=A0A0E4H4Y7_9STRE|nr:FMN-binding protein [Streptococcus varani]CQR24663.1 major membrane immunogen, membrane-anchored lipoprotein [Streptococcus varani]